MELMKNYSDLLTEIECIKQQIKLTKREYEYWSGVKMFDNKDDGVPLNGAGMYKTKTRMEHMERVGRSLDRLNERLEYHEEYKERMDNLMQQFNGLEYKIAYKRYVEFKTHKEIAKELKYSEQYIRKVFMKMKSKSNKQSTEVL